MQDKTRGEEGFYRLFALKQPCYVAYTGVLCSRRIKMKLCYLRTFRISWSAASNFPLNEFPFTFAGLTASMNSAPGSIWTVWERRRWHHTSRTWQRTTRIGKYSRRRRRYAYTNTSKHSVSDTAPIGQSKAMFSG